MRIMEKSDRKSCSKVVSVKKMRSRSLEAIADLRNKIPEIDNVFDVNGRIGTGTFSTVLLGTLKMEKDVPDKYRKKYAIKHHVPTSHPERIIRELKCMVDIGGKDNVVGINCTIRNNESVAFIMPYMPHDRFHDFYNKMDLEEVQCFMKNLLIALRRVHAFNVIHRDVKPSNFLYNRRKREFLLVDFGLAQHVSPNALKQISINELKRRRGDMSDDTANQGGGDRKRLRTHSDEAESLPTKMPLKQLNAITTAATQMKEINSSDPSHGRQAKQISGLSMSERLQKLRNLGPPKTENLSNGKSSSSRFSAATQYNTNRNLTTTAAPKCYCYGKPQVCNICLIRKDVHASRAGTPGYRPPEVLLKYPDQTTAVDIWAAGVIFLSILSSVYPFFKAPDDYVALAEFITLFGDKAIRRTAVALDRLVTLSQHSEPLDLRKLCIRLRNQKRCISTELIKKYQRPDGTFETCKNCEQYTYNCLCQGSQYPTEPLGDNPFPDSAYDLLSKLLELNPHKRISAEVALNHPFFNAVDAMSNL